MALGWLVCANSGPPCYRAHWLVGQWAGSGTGKDIQPLELWRVSWGFSQEAFIPSSTQLWSVHAFPTLQNSWPACSVISIKQIGRLNQFQRARVALPRSHIGKWQGWSWKQHCLKTFPIHQDPCIWYSPVVGKDLMSSVCSLSWRAQNAGSLCIRPQVLAVGMGVGGLGFALGKWAGSTRDCSCTGSALSVYLPASWAAPWSCRWRRGAQHREHLPTNPTVHQGKPEIFKTSPLA